MATTILTKRSNTASAVPLAADLTNSSSGSELAVNTADKRLFTKDSGGTVVELGINPSSLTLSGGTANGVLYLNGSKVATSGSALTFDGSNLGVAVASPTAVIQAYRSSGSSDGGNTGSMLYLQSGGSNANLIKFNGVAATEIAFGRSTGSDSFYWGAIAGPTEWMRLTSTGLGIGTSSPDVKLRITGSNVANKGQFMIDSTTFAQMSMYNGSTRYAQIYADVSGSNTGMYVGTAVAQPLLFATSDLERMRLDSSGNLGLGVTPSAGASWINFQTQRVTLSGGANDRLELAYNYYRTSGQDTYIATDVATRYRQISGQHQFFTAASGTAGNAITFTQAMTLDASGYLGINTTSPSSYNGYLVSISTSASKYAGVFYGNAASNDGQAALQIAKSSTTNTSSQVLVEFFINAFNTGSGRIVANGASAAAFASYSDARLKENITELGPQLQNICAMRPVEFDYKDGSGHQIGFIAQEVQEIYPDVVSEGQNNMLTLTGWSKTEARLIKAIQELKAEFDAYKASHP